MSVYLVNQFLDLSIFCCVFEKKAESIHVTFVKCTFLLIFTSSMHLIKSNTFPLHRLLSAVTFQNFCIINFAYVHFNFHLPIPCFLQAVSHISKSMVRLTLSELEDCTKEVSLIVMWPSRMQSQQWLNLIS